MKRQEFEFEVLVNGKSVAEYAHDGRVVIEGKEGTEFTLKLRNNGGRRALFVPTIDGLSVMDGKEASLDSSGYIVNGYSSEHISGWRTSDDNVAKFFFARVAESYAAKTGKDGNVGVIGCAVFREKEREPERIVIREKEYIPMPYPVYPKPYWPQCPWGFHHHGYCNCAQISVGGNFGGNLNTITLSSAQAGSSMGGQLTSGSASAMNMSTSTMQASAQASTQLDNQLGTGFGDSKYEPVVQVTFEHERTAAEMFVIHYNTRKNLEIMGVEFKRPLYAAGNAFPKGGAYCEPPKGWQG